MAAGATLLVHGAAVLALGVRAAPDTLTYSEWADRLIAFRFDYVSYLRDAAYWNVPPVLYAGFVTIVAIAKLVGGTAWMGWFVALQLVLDAATAAILVHLAARNARAIAPVAALIAYVCAFDVATWARFPLSDIPFLFVSFAAFAVAVSTRGRARLASAIAVLLFRPIGFLWAIALLFATRLHRRVLIAIAAALATLILVHTIFMAHPELWPWQTLKTSIAWNARQYGRGIVVQDRLDLAHRPPVSIADYGLIAADRLAHFFAPAVRSFSTRHLIGAAGYYSILYLLAAVAVVAAMRRELDAQTVAMIRVSILLIALAGVWHSLTNIDFDWRYRLPLLPHFILLASIGAERIAPAWLRVKNSNA